MIEKINSFKHWSLLLFSIATIFGYLYFDWVFYQILFFAYLQSLARVPTLYFIHKFHYKSTSYQKNESEVFLVFYSVFFLIYSFFYIGLMYYASFQMGKFFEPFYYEFVNLFSGFYTPVVVLILIEYIHYKRITAIEVKSKISSNAFAFKNVLQLVTYFPILIVLYFIFSNALMVSLFEVLIFLAINALYEIYIIKDKDMCSVDSQSPNWNSIKSL